MKWGDRVLVAFLPLSLNQFVDNSAPTKCKNLLPVSHSWRSLRDAFFLARRPSSGSKRRQRLKGPSKNLETTEHSAEDRIHFLLVGCEYGGEGQIGGAVDAFRLQKLAQACGTVDVKCFIDTDTLPSNWQTGQKQSTDLGDYAVLTPARDEIIWHWEQMASRCKPGDTFVFWFSGHGDRIAGRDYIVLPQSSNEGEYAKLTDDDVMDLLHRIPDDVKILVVTDCCYGSNLCSLRNRYMDDKQIVHIAASDEPTIDMNNEGFLTSALLEVITDKSAQTTSAPTVADVFRWAWERYGHDFDEMYADPGCHQMLMSASSCFDPESLTWPLWPTRRKFVVGSRLSTRRGLEDFKAFGLEELGLREHRRRYASARQ